MNGVKIAKSIGIPMRRGLERKRESQDRNSTKLRQDHVCYDANEEVDLKDCVMMM